MDVNILIAILAAGGGAIAKTFLDWLLTRGDKRISREDAIATANDKLATDLREELRKENLNLRERLSKLEGRTDELSKTNVVLREENNKLTQQNAKQAEQIVHMQKEIESLQNANRRPGTG